ncbi:DENN domain-containing protein 2B-like [Uloborus diversus]|uniref:DENN domain-containing protein 2B-like n=1 Tax=Uloborus diversus TaxID=327109 RepID=UPI002409F6D9|nr:DENN domain-containing protein 2B-like [Uloborus diversus]
MSLEDAVKYVTLSGDELVDDDDRDSCNLSDGEIDNEETNFTNPEPALVDLHCMLTASQMQKRSMEKQRKLQALVALGKSHTDNKTSMAVSKTQSTLLSQDKNKTDVKGISVGLAFGSAMGGVAGAVIGSIAAATSTSGQPFPTARSGEISPATASSKPGAKGLADGSGENKSENNSDEQERSSSPGFDSDDDDIVQPDEEDKPKPTSSKKRKRGKIKKRSPSCGIQIPIPRLEPPPPSTPREKHFMQLVLPTPNLIEPSSSVAPKSFFRSSPEGTSATQQYDETSPLKGPNSNTPKYERPSALNFSTVAFIDQETASPIKEESVRLENLHSSRSRSSLTQNNDAPTETSPITDVSSQQASARNLATHNFQTGLSPTFPKDVVVETKNNETFTRVAKSGELLSVSEQDATMMSNASDLKAEASKKIAAVLSKRIKVPGKKKRKRSDGRRKSKSENRARKALRTISFILGAFVACWTPYHIVALSNQSILLRNG